MDLLFTTVVTDNTDRRHVKVIRHMEMSVTKKVADTFNTHHPQEIPIITPV
jgi:hypothetical protein